MTGSALRAIALGIFVALAPSAAEAHVGVQTVELLAGALHPWINLESGLTLCALTLWMTQDARSTDTGRFISNGLCVSAGVAIGWFLRIPAPAWLIYLVALGGGACVSLHFQPRRLPWLITLGSMALLAGYYAGVDAAPDIKIPLLFTAGALAGGLVIPLGVAALIAERRSHSLQIGMRILGSWIAAISLMLLALTLHG
jgi:hydrogenase/urease accessory protein HupE